MKHKLNRRLAGISPERRDTCRGRLGTGPRRRVRPGRSTPPQARAPAAPTCTESLAQSGALTHSIHLEAE